MEKVTMLVYHSAYLSTCGMTDEPEPRWPRDYTLVAMIDQGSLAHRQALDHAFAMTQNIDQSWTRNEGVRAMGTRHRSTSPGDIVVLDDGNLYRCALNGWSHIGTTWVAKMQEEYGRGRGPA